jgi:tetratricopeptide (TPR) repeat protein
MLGGLLRRWRKNDGGANAEPASGTSAQGDVPTAPMDWIARGNQALGEGRNDDALQAYARALESDPANAAAWLNHGFAALETGAVGIALEDFQRCVALAAPGERLRADAYFLIGRVHASQGRASDAEAAWQQALADAPEFDEPRTALAQLWLEGGQPQQVLALTEQRAPSLQLALLRAQALHALRRDDEALALLDQLLAADPACAAAHDGRGVVLMDAGRNEEALASFERAAQVGGANAERLGNLSAACQRLARLDDAIAYADRALELAPGDARARWNRALAHFLRGDLARGWEDFEARWEAGVVARDFRLRLPVPRWQGESLQGRSILLDLEQGLGDTIQFLRYVPVLAAAGARVSVRVQRPLVQLARASLPQATVLAPEDAPPAVDFYCELMSVPRHAGIRVDAVPAHVPYLRADAAAVRTWEARLAAAAPGRLRVGLVWSGNPAHLNDANRSMALQNLEPLARVDALFVSMKPDASESDRRALAHWPALLDAGPELKDFGDTAALVQALDVVVSVDTSVAHLAGALGKPVWLLLPWLADWRWMLVREDSPWYPTARLFRQERPQDWSVPVLRVREELQRLAAAPPGVRGPAST